MACIDPYSVDDMENIKSLDDIKGSPECTYVNILSKMIVLHILYLYFNLVCDYVSMYMFLVLSGMIMYIVIMIYMY